MYLVSFESIVDLYLTPQNFLEALTVSFDIPQIRINNATIDMILEETINDTLYLYRSLQSVGAKEKRITVELVGKTGTTYRTLIKDVSFNTDTLYFSTLEGINLLSDAHTIAHTIVYRKSTTGPEPYIYWKNHPLDYISNHFLYRFGKTVKYVCPYDIAHILISKDYPVCESSLLKALSPIPTDIYQRPLYYQEFLVDIPKSKTCMKNYRIYHFVFLMGLLVFLMTCGSILSRHFFRVY